MGLRDLFNRGAQRAETADAGPDFFSVLKGRFGVETAENVVRAFEKMGLPRPRGAGEFVEGSEGCLVFLNSYGLVIRVEIKDTLHSFSKSPSLRIDDNPWILQPLASIDAGAAIIEICPGCVREDDKKNVDFLFAQLKRAQIFFWDDQGEDGGAHNTGRMPVKTPLFPKGVPVVIDRLAVIDKHAVDYLAVDPVREPTEMEQRQILEAEEVQKNLYTPLRQAFDEAWPDKSGLPDASKMRQFWDLCRRCEQEGKLVAGWKKGGDGGFKKARNARLAGEAYEARLKSARPGVSSTSSAVPR